MENKMEIMKTAPFKIGDRVVKLQTPVDGLYDFRAIKEGTITTIIDVAFLKEKSESERWETNDWYVKVSAHKGVWYIYLDFALAQPRHEDAAIDESILEQARELIGVSETVAPVHQPVNN